MDESAETFKITAAALATEAADRLGSPEKFTPEDVLINDDYIGAGYGMFTQLEREAIQVFASQEAILLDPVYTGRAAGGLIDLIHKGYFKKTDQILFWHTGGTPAIFAEKYESDILLKG